LERRANEFLKECRYLPDFNNFKIVGFSNVNECSHVIRIYMGNGTVVERSMNGEDLGRGYYSRLVFVLLNMFEEVLEIQEAIDKEKQEKEEKDRLLMIRILNPTHYSDMFVGRIVFEVLPSINLDDKACVTSKALLNSLINIIQSNTFVHDIDIGALERNINTEFKRYYNRFESFWIETNGFNGNYIFNIRFQGLAFNKSIDRDLLYSQIIYILEELVFRANEMEATAEMKTEFIRMQINSIYGLPGDYDGDAYAIMHRGRGYGKSLAQIRAIDDLLKNGISKIQIAPGKKLEKLHNDILDSYRYIFESNYFSENCATAIVRYCEADAKATMEAALAMKENNKQVVLEQLEEEDPQVPMKIFESLVTGSPNGEAEILIDVNKEDKKMMIPVVRRPEIKEVIFNEPATIVFWKDGTKTVVKCGKGEKFDPEKGVAIALAKKMLYSKDYSRVIASSDDWKKAKEAKKKAEDKKKASAKKKPMPKLPVNANITKTSTVKKTTRKGAK
jgi:hypothetical protein